MSMKRLLSLLLAIVMVVGMIPAPAYATTESEDVGVTVPVEDVIPGESVPEASEVPGESVPEEDTPQESEDPVEMEEGEQYTAEIVGNEELTYFAFTPGVSCTYTFTSHSDTDTYGYLYDNEMNQLTYDDDGGENNNFGITYQLNAGETYILGVRFYHGSDSGSFPVSVTHTGDWSTETLRDATCTQSGLIQYTCACGDSRTEETGLVNHYYQYQDETDRIACENCGLELVATPVTMGESVEVSMPEHDYGYASFVPENGCAYTFQVELNGAIGCNLYNHKWERLTEVNSFETITLNFDLVAGQTYYLQIGYNGNKVEGTATVTVNHSTKGKINRTEYTAHTDTEDGSATYTCVDCGYSWSEVIPAGHMYTNGICDSCGIEWVMSGECGDSAQWELNMATGLLTISGTGAMYDYTDVYSNNPAPWTFWRHQVKTVVVEEGITAIGTYTFSQHRNLTSVSLPSTLESIGYYAFMYAEQLKELDLPEGLTVLGHMALSDSGITSLTLPTTLTEFDVSSVDYAGSMSAISVAEGHPTYTSVDGVLYTKDMTTLVKVPCQATYVDIPEGVTTIGHSAFFEAKIKGVNFPSTLTTIEVNAFRDCDDLVTIVLPDTVTTLGSEAFFHCDQLESVVLPAGLTRIEGYTFDQCVRLKRIEIPAGVTYIGEDAFARCEDLNTVIFQGSAPVGISGSAFQDTTTNVYYPTGDDTWTDEFVGQQYGGNLNWFELTGVVIMAHPEDTQAEAGRTAVLYAEAYGVVSYQWQVSTNGETWENIEGATSTELTLVPAMEDNGKQYRCLMIDETGNEWYTEAASLEVIPAITVTAESLGNVFTMNIADGSQGVLRFTPVVSGEYMVVYAGSVYCRNTSSYGDYYQNTGRLFELKAGEEYVFDLTDLSGEVTVSIREAWNLTVNEPFELTMNSYSSDIAYFTAPEDGWYIFNFGILSRSVHHWVEDSDGGYSEGVSSNYAEAYELTGGVTYSIDIDNYADQDLTVTVGVYTPQELAVGETVTGSMYTGDSQVFFMTPEVSGRYYINAGMDTYVYRDGEYLSGTDGWQLYDLEAGREYVIRVSNYYSEPRDWSLTVVEPQQIQPGFTQELTLKNSDRMVYAFTPDVSAMYILERGLDYLSLDFMGEDGNGISAWGYPNNGFGYFVEAGKTYYIRLSNYTEYEITTNFGMRNTRTVTPGQEVTLNGSADMVWVEVEESGVYTFTLPYNTNTSIYVGDEQNASCMVTHERSSAYYLEAGSLYTVMIENYNGDETWNFSIEEGMELELNVTKELNLPSMGLQMFNAQVEESGYYTVRHTLAKSMNFHAYDIQNWSSEYLNSWNIDGTGWIYPVYMEAGKPYGLYTYSWEAEDYSGTITLEKAPTPTSVGIYGEDTVAVDGRLQIDVYFAPGYAGEEYTVTVDDETVAQVSGKHSRGVYLLGLSEGSTTVTVTTASGLTSEMIIHVAEPMEMTMGNPVEISGAQGEKLFYTFTTGDYGSYVLRISKGLSFGLTSETGAGYGTMDRWTFGDEVYEYISLNSNTKQYLTVHTNPDVENAVVEIRPMEEPQSLSLPETLEVYVNDVYYFIPDFGTPWAHGGVSWQAEGASNGISNTIEGFRVSFYEVGKVTVTATHGDFSVTCTVTVKEPPALDMGENELKLSAWTNTERKFTPEVTGFYRFDCPADISINLSNEIGAEITWWNDPDGKYVGLLQVGVEYTVSAYNHSDAIRTITLTIGEPEEIQLDSQVNVYVPYNRHWTYVFKPQETDYYTAFYTNTVTDRFVWNTDREHIECVASGYDTNGNYGQTYLLEAGQTYLLSGCFYNGDGSNNITVTKTPEATSVSLGWNTNMVTVGSEMEVWLYFEPGYAMEGYSVSFGTPGIAEVSSIDGRTVYIKGLAEGRTTVTVTTDNGLTAALVLNCVHPIDVELGQELTRSDFSGEMALRFTTGEAGYYAIYHSITHAYANLGWGSDGRMGDENGGVYNYYWLPANTTYVANVGNNGEAQDITFIIDKCLAPTTMTIPETAEGTVGETIFLSVKFDSYWHFDSFMETMEGDAIEGTWNPSGIGMNLVRVGTGTVTVTCRNYPEVTAVCTVTVKEPDPLVVGDNGMVNLDSNENMGYKFTPESSGWYAFPNPNITLTVKGGDGSVATGRGYGNVRFCYLNEGIEYKVNYYNSTNAYKSFNLTVAAPETLEQGAEVPVGLEQQDAAGFYFTPAESGAYTFRTYDWNPHGFYIIDADGNDIYPNEAYDGNTRLSRIILEEGQRYLIVIRTWGDVYEGFLGVDAAAEPENIYLRAERDFLLPNFGMSIRLNFEPLDAYDQVTWSISNTDVLAFEGVDTTSTYVVALKPGTAVVTATTASGVSASYTVKVVDPVKALVSLDSAAKVTVPAGGVLEVQSQFPAEGKYIVTVNSDEMTVNMGEWASESVADGMTYVYQYSYDGAVQTVYLVNNSNEDLPVEVCLHEAGTPESVHLSADTLEIQIDHNAVISLVTDDPMDWARIRNLYFKPEGIAFVNYSDGRDLHIYGEQLGTTTLYVELDNGQVLSCPVTVTNTPSYPSINLGEPIQVGYDGGFDVYYNFTPEVSGWYAVHADMNVDVGVYVFYGDWHGVGSGEIWSRSGDTLDVYLEAGQTYVINVWSQGDAEHYEGTFWIDDDVNLVTEMVITKEPSMKTVVKGFLPPDLEGLEMTVTFADGTTYDYSFENDYYNIGSFELVIQGCEENGDGTGTVILGCNDLTVTYQVNLIENPVASLEVIDDEVQPWVEGAGYSEGSGTYSTHHLLKDMKFRVTYTDGTSETIGPEDKVLGYRVGRFYEDLSGQDGKIIITFSLLGQEVEYQAQLVESPVSYLEIIQGPDPLIVGEDDRLVKNEHGEIYFRPDWGRGFDGMVIRIHYTEGGYEDITYDQLEYPGGEDFFAFPEHNNYAVEAVNDPGYGFFAYFVGQFGLNENGAVPMILHYMGKTVPFEVPVIDEEALKPYLSYRWLYNMDGLWYENGEMDEQHGFGMTMLDECYMVFYLNYLDVNGEWVKKPVQITTNEYLVADRLMDLGETVTSSLGEYYYRIRPVEWDTMGVVSADWDGETVTMECFVQRGEFGFYSAPEMTNDAYINQFVWNPDTDEERVFYFGIDDDSLAILNVQVEMGGENVNAELLENGMWKITVNGDVDYSFWLELRIVRQHIDGWDEVNYCGIDCRPGESTKPYLAYRWLNHWGEGWFENQDDPLDTWFQAVPNTEHWMVFYVNYLNADGEWVREPVHVTAGNYVELNKLTDLGEPIQDGAVNSDHYYRLNIAGDSWEQIGEVHYEFAGEMLTLEIPIRRGEFGFYSAPEMTNDTFINGYQWDPDTDDARVFYFGLDNNDFEITNLYATEGADFVNIVRLENGMYEITVNGDMGFGFWLDLHIEFQHIQDENWIRENNFGIECRPGESKMPYISSRWLENQDEVWYESSEDYFDRSVSLAKGHDRWLVFYVNYLDANGEWVREQIDVTANEQLMLTKVTDIEDVRIAEGVDPAHYYRVSAVEWGEGQIYYEFNGETLVFEMPVVLDPFGFYSEPVISEDTFLNWYEWNPDTDEERVFYFGVIEESDWINTDVYATDDAAAWVSVEELENGMWQITVNGDVDYGFWLNLHIVRQHIDGWYDESDCGIECHPAESKKPYLSFRWLDNWGEGWYEHEDWGFGRDMFNMTAYDQNWMIFYVNYLNEDGVWVSQPVDVTSNEVLTLEKVVDIEGEQFAEGAQNAEYYYRVTSDAAYWDHLGEITYQYGDETLVVYVPIQRNPIGFYSEPNMSNETYLNTFFFDSRAEENVLYLGLDLDDDSIYISDISMTNQENSEPMPGAEFVREINVLENGMYEIVLDSNVTEGFSFEVNVFISNGVDTECHQTGIWCEPMEIKEPHLAMIWLDGDEEGYVTVNLEYYTTDPFQTNPAAEAAVMFVMNTYDENGELVQTPVKVTGSEGLILNSLDPEYYDVREDDPYAEYYVAVTAAQSAWNSWQSVSYVYEGVTYSIDVEVRRADFGLYTGPEMTDENYTTRFYYSKDTNSIWVGEDFGWTIVDAWEVFTDDNGIEHVAENSELYELGEVSNSMVKLTLTDEAVASGEPFVVYFFFLQRDPEGNEVVFRAGIPCYPIPVKLEITKQPEDAVGALGEVLYFTVEVNKEDVSYHLQNTQDGGASWLVSGAAGSKTAKLQCSALTEGRIGWQYRCVITDSEGNRVTSEVATITVK